MHSTSTGTLLRQKLYPHRRYLRWLRRVAQQVPAQFPLKEKFARWVNLLTINPGERFTWRYPRSHVTFTLDPSDYIQWQMYYYGGYQRHVINLIKQSLAPGRVFLDIGAHIGQNTILAADYMRLQNWNTARVIAFEPDPRIFNQLQHHISQNALESVVSAYPFAVSDKEGTTPFHLAASPNSGNGSLADLANNAPNAQTGECIEVKTITIDQFLTEQPIVSIGLIKADIEGAELLALNGAANTIARDRPRLILEAHSSWMRAFGYTMTDLQQFLHEMHYTTYIINSTGRLAKIEEVRNDNMSNDLLCVPRESDNFR